MIPGETAILTRIIAAQAEVIQAQRANLDAARKALRDLLPYARMTMTRAQKQNSKFMEAAILGNIESAVIALEGVEPEEKPMAE